MPIDYTRRPSPGGQPSDGQPTGQPGGQPSGQPGGQPPPSSGQPASSGGPINYAKRPKAGSAPPTSPPPTSPPPSSPPPTSPPPPGPPPVAGGRPVSLSKVTLTKSAPSVSLTKQGSATGLLRVNLNWNQNAGGGGGFLKRMAGGGAFDLDLGCLYEFNDGSKGVVQALGNAFTSHSSFTRENVVWLDGDDRSGANTGGENLFVNLKYAANINRVLVFAMIYSGAANWAAANAVVTLFPVSGPEVEIRLDEHDPSSKLCAIALLENVRGELQVRREVRYIQGSQSTLDRAYGWGMKWSAGSK